MLTAPLPVGQIHAYITCVRNKFHINIFWLLLTMYLLLKEDMEGQDGEDTKICRHRPSVSVLRRLKGKKVMTLQSACLYTKDDIFYLIFSKWSHQVIRLRVLIELILRCYLSNMVSNLLKVMASSTSLFSWFFSWFTTMGHLPLSHSIPASSSSCPPSLHPWIFPVVFLFSSCLTGPFNHPLSNISYAVPLMTFSILLTFR